MCGKSWLTGQNWIDQFLGNCARAGHYNLIGDLTDGNSAYELINNPERTFECRIRGDRHEQMIGENQLWIDREYVARREQYVMTT